MRGMQGPVRRQLTFYEVGDVLEGPGLLAVAEDGERLPCQRLRHEVGHHAPVVQRHVGAVRVEDAHHPDLQTKHGHRTVYHGLLRSPSASHCQKQDHVHPIEMGMLGADELQVHLLQSWGRGERYVTSSSLACRGLPLARLEKSGNSVNKRPKLR